MEIESPADAWYVWVGVAIVSVGVAGIVLSLPPEPPPDASGGANAIDRVAVSEYGTATTYEHNAEYVRVGTKQVALRNDAGTDHASVAFGSLTPVSATADETRQAASAIISGVPPGQFVAEHAGFETETELRDAFREVRQEIDRNGTDWRETDGTLRIRSVRLAGETVVLVRA